MTVPLRVISSDIQRLKKRQFNGFRLDKNTHSGVFIMEGDDENEQTPSGETDETVYGEGIYGSLERTDKTQRMTVNYAIQVTVRYYLSM